MSSMVKDRPGYHSLFAQIPDAVWEALVADSIAAGVPINQVLAQLLAEHYKIAAKRMPKPPRAGRPPKTRRTK